jgi:hypothetical protein
LLLETTMYWPSGVNAGETNALLGPRVSGLTCCPSGSTSQRFSLPERSLTNTIVFPSGAKRGWPSKPDPLVMRVAWPPVIGSV